MSLHPALLTFYIPSSLLVVFCSAIIIHVYCALSRQSLTSQQRQLCQEHVDAKLRLLLVASSSRPSSVNVDPVRCTGLCGRRLTVFTLMMVFGILGWGCAAAAAVLERRTLAGTVAACFYAVCTSTIALLLFVVHPPTSAAPTTSRCSWRIFTRYGCLKQLTNWRSFDDWKTARNITPRPVSVVAKQVVYSIENADPPAFHLCTTPSTIQAGDDVDYITDEQEVALGMRDCTGSSCTVSASLSAMQLPVSVSECEECRFCRSTTDGSTDGRCFSRHSTRMKDFDDFSGSSDDENCDSSLEGGWWNGEVDVDGCSIHRAPCPSPASACSSRGRNDDEESRRSSPLHAAVSPGHGRCKRRWSVVGASPATSRKTPRRRRHEDETEHIRHRRRQKTVHSHVRDTECMRPVSRDRCSPRLTANQKRRRIRTKPRQNNSDT